MSNDISVVQLMERSELSPLSDFWKKVGKSDIGRWNLLVGKYNIGRWNLLLVIGRRGEEK